MDLAIAWRLVPCLLSLTALSACGGESADRSDSAFPECIGAARYGDVTYHEVGFTNREGGVLQEDAVFATCVSVDRDGVSEALRREPSSVEARSLPGYRPQEVIAVQVTDSAWSVLVADDAPDRLLRGIREAGLLNAGEA